MKIKKNNILAFVSYYVCLMLLYIVFKYIFKTSFIIRVLFSQTNILETYFYQYALVISVAFTIAYHLVSKKYNNQSLFKRIFIFAPLVFLITLFLGGFFSGILFSIHDMQIGFYPGLYRFLSNILEYAMTSSILSPLIVLGSLRLFTLVLLVCSVIILELLRIKLKTI